MGGGTLISPVALRLGGAVVGGGGGRRARAWEVGGETTGLDPGTGGGRLDLLAATEGVIGEVGDACCDPGFAYVAVDGIWIGGCLGLDGRVGGGPAGCDTGGIGGGPSRLTGRESSLAGILRETFRACTDISSSDSEPSLGDNIWPACAACSVLAAGENQ